MNESSSSKEIPKQLDNFRFGRRASEYLPSASFVDVDSRRGSDSQESDWSGEDWRRNGPPQRASQAQLCPDHDGSFSAEGDVPLSQAALIPPPQRDPTLCSARNLPQTLCKCGALEAPAKSGGRGWVSRGKAPPPPQGRSTLSPVCVSRNRFERRRGLPDGDQRDMSGGGLGSIRRKGGPVRMGVQR